MKLLYRFVVVVALVGGLGLRTAELHAHGAGRHHDASCTACRVLDTPLDGPVCDLDVNQSPRTPCGKHIIAPPPRPHEPPALGAWSLRGPPTA